MLQKITLLLLLIVTQNFANALEIPLTVIESANVGANNFPITAVVPLERGKYQDASQFWLKSESGEQVPGQVDVLNRWWATDQSIRHVRVIFPATVGARELTKVILTDEKKPESNWKKITTVENDDCIIVDTGAVVFCIQKEGTGILDTVYFDADHDGKYQPNELVFCSKDSTGFEITDRIETINFSSRNDVKVEIEESGDYYSVVKISAPTHYNVEKMLPGMAIRIYAWAGLPLIKIDVQLQNGDSNVVYSSPYYFESADLKLSLANDYVEQDPLRVEGFERYTANTDYVIRTNNTNVTAAIRYAWETWPNGIKVENDALTFELFPSWSAQLVQKDGTNPQISETGLYWLDDMQAVYKEIMLAFGDVENLSKTFTYHPIVRVPIEWYKKTEVTMDLGGSMPSDHQYSSQLKYFPTYSDYAYRTDKFTYYNFGWNNFLVDIGRKLGPAQGGGWPYAGEGFIASGDPADYFKLEQSVIGELNVRPQYLARYNYAKDNSLLQLSTNPYSGSSWRKYIPSDREKYLDSPHIDGTFLLAKPRDDQHAWFYHVEQFYYHSANPWIKDWYEFIAQFRQATLRLQEPFPDRTTRGRAHQLGHALQAYRITGNENLMEAMQFYVLDIAKHQDGDGNVQPSRSTDGRFDAAIWLGYLSRELINLMIETDQYYCNARTIIDGLFRLNNQKVKFGYNVGIDSPVKNPATAWKCSNSFAIGIVDPLAWYIMKFDRTDYASQLLEYANKGLTTEDCSASPIMDKQARAWNGDWHGRIMEQFLGKTWNIERPAVQPAPDQ